MVIKYFSNDGKSFETREACEEYEQKLKKERVVSVQNAMVALDEQIWEKYYPSSEEGSKPGLHVAYIWLKNDIVHILSDKAIDAEEAGKDILSMIKSSEYGEEILARYISMSAVMEEVGIRKDFLSAFMTIKDVSRLANKLGYALGESDLEQLARLHKSNRCRKRIERLLTVCNFHCECGKFIRKEYDEFINIK